MSRDAVIVFDGACVLCNGWVRFLLRHDRKARFLFAPMQSQAGAAMLRAHGLDPLDPTSFLLVDHEGVWTDTTAIARVLEKLGLPWRASATLLRAVPPKWRDAGYRHVARQRYRWFGRRDACMVPDATQQARFLK